MTQIEHAELAARLRVLADADKQRAASPDVRGRVMNAWDRQHSEAATVRASRSRYRLRVGLLLATAAGATFFAVKTPWRSELLATVEAADGTHYPLRANVVLRPSAGTAMLTFKDGSRVEVRSDSELMLERAVDGIGIQLHTGGLIVDAAAQPQGHLYVHTRELTAAVGGTKSVVNADEGGSRVMAVEGEVQVREGTIERYIRPGERMSTSPAVATRGIKDDVGWSRQGDVILAAFTRGMTETAGPIRTAAAQSGAVATAAGQPATLDFETASIRECDPDHLPETPDGGRGGGANSFQLTPGRLRALCMTMATLVRTAFGYGPIDLDFIEAGRGGLGIQFSNVYGLGVEDGRRVRGGPDWMRSMRYTVEAVAGPDAKPDALTLRGVMLQRLLERRAALKAHIDTEQAPAFALTVPRGGMKIRPVESSACDVLPGRAGAPLLNGFPGSVLSPPRNFADVRRGEKPSCGLWTQRNGPNMVLVGGGVPLSALVTSFGFQLGGVRVLDRTGVTDRFNFVLEFVLDDNTPGLGRGGPALPGAERTDVEPASTIFTALEDQLGLKLERASAGREFIVVDHIERPTPN